MAAGKRTIRIGGRDYPVLLPSIRDPRLHVAAVLLTLQVLGQTVLDFRLSVAQILMCLAAGALIEFVVAFFKDKVIMWPASGLLTGNSTAFILRVPGTFHGQWWSTRGWYIFVGVVAVSMASKYFIRWKGRHIFNPSNLGLVLAFVALGPRYTEPQDLWWIPMGSWMIVTYAILIGGGLLIGWELKLIGLELGYMAGFALFAALALLPVPDHCMVASWHATSMCGTELWKILVTSPELLIFAFFMVPDPRTVPDGQVLRLPARPDHARVLDQDGHPGQPGHRLRPSLRAGAPGRATRGGRRAAAGHSADWLGRTGHPRRDAAPAHRPAGVGRILTAQPRARPGAP